MDNSVKQYWDILNTLSQEVSPVLWTNEQAKAHILESAWAGESGTRRSNLKPALGHWEQHGAKGLEMSLRSRKAQRTSKQVQKESPRWNREVNKLLKGVRAFQPHEVEGCMERFRVAAEKDEELTAKRINQYIDVLKPLAQRVPPSAWYRDDVMEKIEESHFASKRFNFNAAVTCWKKFILEKHLEKYLAGAKEEKRRKAVELARSNSLDLERVRKKLKRKHETPSAGPNKRQATGNQAPAADKQGFEKALGRAWITKGDVEFLQVLPDTDTLERRVRLAKLNGKDKLYASKEMKKRTPNLRREFEKEALKLWELKHPNLLSLQGVVKLDGSRIRCGRLAILLEYCPRGSLRDHLNSFFPKGLGKDAAVTALIQVASAMEYLHGSQVPIVHMDLKSDNILITENFTYKVADFGLSKYVDLVSTRNTLESPGSVPWMAPERLTKKPSKLPSVDVYSFAVVIFEILTGKVPWAELSLDEIRVRVLAGGRPDSLLELPPNDPLKKDRLWQLMVSCQKDARKRPSFEEILETLTELAKAECPGWTSAVQEKRIALPMTWQSPGDEWDASYAKLVPKKSTEFKRLRKYIQEHGGDPKEMSNFSIKEILRVENYKLFRKYQAHLETVHSQNERWLFHGLTGEGAYSAVTEGKGLQIRNASMKRNNFGVAHYFAMDLRLADKFTFKGWVVQRKDAQGEDAERNLLLCRVAVGKSHPKGELKPSSGAGNRSINQIWQAALADSKNRGPDDGYDSIYGEEWETELMVFQDCQVYPAYWIKYVANHFRDPYGDAMRKKLRRVPTNCESSLGLLPEEELRKPVVAS